MPGIRSSAFLDFAGIIGIGREGFGRLGALPCATLLRRGGLWGWPMSRYGLVFSVIIRKTGPDARF
jgi:hypothetical protein